ncbi:MAG: carbon-nitrogen hydrolase family protein [Armatimonadetes bacterium]|nr:carbon-nitrogen hydrolase family protein [Armatimonadota bacterium]
MQQNSQNRIVTLSALCLLDEGGCRTADYVAGMIEQTAQRQASDLIVAPLTPFLSFREGRELEDVAIFSGLARAYRTYLAVALTENAGDGRQFYTSLLLDRDGEVAGKYRKTHALPDDPVALGDSLPVFRTDFGTVGLSIGTDFYFPEVYNVERLQGADILVWQDWPERFREYFQWEPLLKARPLDSHAHMIAAMYADPRCYIANRYEIGMQGAAWGRSMILNRVGVPIADTGHEDGIASATVEMDKRKADPYLPVYEAENIFFVNCYGDRTAFHSICEPWKEPEFPAFKQRRARVAVGYFGMADRWSHDNIPEVMFRVLDEAARFDPDIVLLSEMTARGESPTIPQVADMVAERARRMNSYILIGGIDDSGRMSHGWLWDRQGEVVFRQSIYWPKGFDKMQVYDTDFARIGVHLCGDLYTGEIDRSLALMGAEIILDPSQMWGADGYNNELLLRARAVDNGCWMACSHWNSSDPGLRSLIVDPYGYVMGASQFQQDGAFFVDIDFDCPKVYYAGRKPAQPQRGQDDIASYLSEDIPEQRPGWRQMIFSRRRPELYGIIPATNEFTLKYRREKGLYD